MDSVVSRITMTWYGIAPPPLALAIEVAVRVSVWMPNILAKNVGSVAVSTTLMALQPPAGLEPVTPQEG
jgi:hypothetical protein